jgi:hypothetical protein
METRTIPETDWLSFADRFSRHYVGWLATIQVLDGSGVLLLAKDLPLQGISFDTRGSRPNSIAVSVGDSPEDHVRHVVDLPLHLRAADEPDGSIDLQIEPANGSQTLIHLRGPVH